MKTKTLSIHWNYAYHCPRCCCLNIMQYAMLLLGQSYGFVKLTLNESINIVKTFKHNYRLKLFVVWEK